MSWIKKGPVLAALVAGLIVWALVFFFFDPLLKRALIAGGQAAAGARVDVGSVRSKWLKGSLEIARVAVADREAPMQNLAELSRAAFRLDLSAALRGKAVVREAALEGLRFGTPRKTSGVLPKAPPPSALSLAIQRQVAPAKESALASIGDVRANAAASIDATKLEGVKKLDEAKMKTAEIEQRWKGKAAEAKAIEAEARAIADQLKGLGGGSSVLQNVQAAQQAQTRLVALIAKVETQKTEARKDLAEAQSLLEEADKLRKKDLNGLLAAAGLPSFDSQDLARRLLGTQTSSKLSTALRWMRVAREKTSAKKAAAPPPPPRRQGVDIEFPRARTYPQYLLEGAKITGSLDGVAGGALDLAGLLNGVTSNPRLYGKPATLTLAGKSAAGPRVTLNGRLDQQNDPVGVSVEFDGSGFSLAGASLGDGAVGGAFKDGLARVKGHLESRGEEWTGAVRVEATGVSLEPKVTLPGAAGTLVSDALRALHDFYVNVEISGREDDLKLAFTSNAGDAVASAMKKAVSGRLEAQKKILEAQLAGVYDQKSKDAAASLNGLAGKLLGPLDAQKNSLNRQLQEAVQKSLGKSLRLEKLFR